MSRPLVKICGLRDVRQARVAAQAGADMVGLVFAPSRRRVTPEQALEITSATYQARPRVVGVFANEDMATIGRLAASLRLDLAQLSGDEPPEECARLRVPYTKVIHVRDGMTASDLLHIAHGYPDAVALVLDTGGVTAGRDGQTGANGQTSAGGQTGDDGDGARRVWGGTGVPFDWSVAAEVVRRAGRPVMLAGGLRPDNVAAAVRIVAPWAVDVSSGVETDGVKDDEKVRAFVAAARGEA